MRGAILKTLIPVVALAVVAVTCGPTIAVTETEEAQADTAAARDDSYQSGAKDKRHHIRCESGGTSEQHGSRPGGDEYTTGAEKDEPDYIDWCGLGPHVGGCDRYPCALGFSYKDVTQAGSDTALRSIVGGILGDTESFDVFLASFTSFSRISVRMVVDSHLRQDHRDEINQVVSDHLCEILAVYERELARDSELDGLLAVVLKFHNTDEIGGAEVALSDLEGTTLEREVVDALKRWPFPKPGVSDFEERCSYLKNVVETRASYFEKSDVWVGLPCYLEFNSGVYHSDTDSE